MSAVLEVALISASAAIVVLVACLVPVLFLARRQLKQLALTAENMKINLESLILDSRELVSNVRILSERANLHLDNVGRMVHTVHQWTERADRLVNELGSVVEPRVFSLVRNVNLLRLGVTTFFQRLLHPDQENQTDHPTRKEIDRV
jgi:uncharacterized protein YoxC